MASIKGKWVGGQGDHLVYEFFDTEFRFYSNAGGGITSGTYRATENTVTFMIGGVTVTNGYEISGAVVRFYPPDGGSALVFRRSF